MHNLEIYNLIAHIMYLAVCISFIYFFDVENNKKLNITGMVLYTLFCGVIITLDCLEYSNGILSLKKAMLSIILSLMSTILFLSLLVMRGKKI